MAVLLALLGAVSYGVSDFVGGLVSRRVGGYSVAWLAQVGGLVAILLLLPFVGGTPSGGDLAWAAAAGVGNAVGTVFVFRGLATGRMGVVAPVSGVVAATVPVVVGWFVGERLSLLVWVGIAVALPAIWLVAREPGNAVTHRRAGLDLGVARRCRRRLGLRTAAGLAVPGLRGRGPRAAGGHLRRRDRRGRPPGHRALRLLGAPGPGLRLGAGQRRPGSGRGDVVRAGRTSAAT